MKKLLLTLLATLSLHANAQTIELVEPKAGIDYPTDFPEPKFLKDKLILAVDETSRVVVDGDSELIDAEAGIDFPTDTPPPSDLKILLLKDHIRLPVKIEEAVAGIDFPTDGPANLERDFLVWNFGQNQRVRLKSIKTIEFAVAGVDYPTDGPANLDRSFYVYTSYSKDFSLRRTIIQSTFRGN